MNELNDIYSALMVAKSANEALASWQTKWDGRDRVAGDQLAIERGIAAYHKLAGELRDGRKHIERPDDCDITSCECSAPNAAPPCSFCTSGIDEDAKHD